MTVLANYYMDFLETDFHKRRLPKRSVQLQNKKNLRVGLNLAKYDAFQSVILKALEKGMASSPLKIRRGKYQSVVPQKTQDIISRHTNSVSDDLLVEVATTIASNITDIAKPDTTDIGDAISRSIDSTADTIRTKIVTPFVMNLEGLLQSSSGANIESIFTLEESLVAILSEPFDELINEWVPNVYGGQTDPIAESILEILDGDTVRSSIRSYFSSFSANDLFFEIKELVDNNLILDKQDLYLYFCDVQYLGNKYPIFYVPISIIKIEGVYHLAIEPVVYINKKAIEYVVQEVNKEREQQGVIKSISDRIIYPQEQGSSMPDILTAILADIVDYFQLSPEIVLTDPSRQKTEGLAVTISNSMHICIFDKSDEALVNDYEEILDLMKSQDATLMKGFMGLIDDFISSSPQSFINEVNDDWDGNSLEDKLVFNSPIPLNPEQRQILSALKKNDCKYIAVSGPPGTGKSHTITAIVFEAILDNKSVLVLSDKKEALDVVEEKITSVMNQVRVSDEFQNPILRLGKTGNTYGKILSTTSINKIRNQARAVKSQEDNLEDELQSIHHYLTTHLGATVENYGRVDLKDIQELVRLENKYENGDAFPISLTEILESEDSHRHIVDTQEAMADLDSALHFRLTDVTLLELFESICGDRQSVDDFSKFLSFSKIIQELRATYQDRAFLKYFSTVTKEHAKSLQSILKRYQQLGAGIFGYLFKGKKISQLSEELNNSMDMMIQIELTEDSVNLELASEFFTDTTNALREHRLLTFAGDSLRVIHDLMIPDDHLLDEIDFEGLGEDIETIISYGTEYPQSAEKIGLSPKNIWSYFENNLSRVSEDIFEDILVQLTNHKKLSSAFDAVPDFDYTGGLSSLHELMTTRMTNILDRRLLDFYDNDKSTASTLRGIIRKKQRFPKDDFEKLKKAFPCIVAGIRDYAEYIPLEPGIFDVVIIDEASQVSIAQALPALLRAKKVVVLGDKKQFSNVKTAHARSDTNREYLNRLEASFKKNVSTGPSELERLTKFNIKTSILDFFEFISNYEIMLLKHFRGYRELISYSSKYFYNGGLQAIRIRGKLIEDTIKFSLIEHDGKQELIRNTNTLECEFIINQLRQLKSDGDQSSIGIITPHTNQQKLIASAISTDPDQDYFYEKMKLKIMTFDTCQGEERDIIFYSMVASPVEDKLWAIFIKDLDAVDLEDGGQIKAQRLNVGFSRAKECMHFITSKPLEDFGGSIGIALRHYEKILREGHQLPEASDVDSRSPMEAKVLEWVKNTSFFQKNSEHIELKAQFSIGDYLKQLDPRYDHPAYRVDFLLLYMSEDARQHSIIIEYDGFSEHFGHFSENANVDEYNYDSYYTADHVEREKILEGYGYKFLRINRFNVGDDPVQTLNDRLLNLIRTKPKLSSATAVRDLVASQESGQLKECPRCGELLPLGDFKDSNLETGIGRICVPCKDRNQLRPRRVRKIQANAKANSSRNCPKCGSTMVRRSGRYGDFYGCSTYPRCRGTRRIIQ